MSKFGRWNRRGRRDITDARQRSGEKGEKAENAKKKSPLREGRTVKKKNNFYKHVHRRAHTVFKKKKNNHLLD